MSEQYPDLTLLSGYPFPIYVSPGCEERGRVMAARCQRAREFLSNALQAEAGFTAFVLSPAHWSEYATEPTYGMAHSQAFPPVLIMPGENNAFWRSMVPPLETLSPEVAAAARALYGQPGSVDICHLSISCRSMSWRTCFSGRRALTGWADSITWLSPQWAGGWPQGSMGLTSLVWVLVVWGCGAATSESGARAPRCRTRYRLGAAAPARV